MGIRKEDCVISKAQQNTAGGTTFYIKLPDASKVVALCFRRKRNSNGNGDIRCTNPAGAGTWHKGTGACKLHGGLAGRPVISGNHAAMTKLRLKEKVEEYLNLDRSKLLDLTKELATARAMFDDFMENFPDPTDEHYGIAFHRFTVVVGTIGNLVEKISKVDSRNTLTAAQVMYLRATITDIMLKYLPDIGVRERAVRELAARLGGDVGLEMRPSEIVIDERITDV